MAEKKKQKPCVHLVKLCVGIDSPRELLEWERELSAQLKPKKQPLEDSHWTRHRPKRAPELLEGKGSLFWVINGIIRVRHRILRLDEVEDKENNKFCAIIYDPTVILVEPRPRRAFQGWRYLEAEDAPPDLKDQKAARAQLRKADQLPKEMLMELEKLGLA